MMKNKRIILVALVMGFISMMNARSHKIGVIGTGYVGLVLGVCLAEFGNEVICADIDEKKIGKLNLGELPIYEPGLQELMLANVTRGTLSFSTNIPEVIRATDVIFIAVGTPMTEDGKADISGVEAVTRTIAEHSNGYKVICTKSTVPIGTGNKITKIISKILQNNNFDVVSNPEFLREGSAVTDFLYPDRIVIGVDSEKASEIVQDIYAPLTSRNVPLLLTDIISAETIKYASNSFLAVKISFINEIAHLCDMTGAEVQTVAQGMGLDTRIGSKFLKPGPGFGGSCFPKDAHALLHKAHGCCIELKMVKTALEVNEDQKRRVYKKLVDLLDVLGFPENRCGVFIRQCNNHIFRPDAVQQIRRMCRYQNLLLRRLTFEKFNQLRQGCGVQIIFRFLYANQRMVFVGQNGGKNCQDHPCSIGTLGNADIISPPFLDK